MRSRALLARSGWSEGDVWTVALGLTLAVALAVTSIPAALRFQPARTVSAPAAPVAPVAPETLPPAVALPPPAPVGELPPMVFPEPVPAGPGPAGPAGPPTPGEGPVAPPPTAAPAPRIAVGAVLPFSVLAADGSAGGLTTATDGSVHAATGAPGAAKGPSTLVSWNARAAELHRGSPPDQPANREQGVAALATTPLGDLLVADAATSTVLAFARSSRSWTKLATIPDVGPCLLPITGSCQPGLGDTAPLLRGLAVDRDGTAYVADAGQGVVWRLASGSTSPEPWYADEDLVGNDALAGLGLDATGSLLMTVTRLSGLMADGSGVLDRVERSADGTAGARSTVAVFPPGEGPVDVAVGSAGLYVALRDADAVVVLDADGAEQLRVTDALLKAPTALALADGRLLVTSGASRPTVVQVGVADRLT